MPPLLADRIDDVNVHDTDYCALNCRAGIFAGMLEAGWGIDPAAIYLRTALDSRHALEPMERGEIAGASCGSFPNETWTELFGVRVLEWHPASRADMIESLNTAVRGHRLVLAAHDGYWDPLASDKYLRRHMRHNSLVYGTTPDGSEYKIADRTHRASMDVDTLWRCMAEDSTTFAVLVDPLPFVGDRKALLTEGATAFYRAMTTTLGDDEIARMAAATEADVRSPDERWLQSHLFLNGIGRSRVLLSEAVCCFATAEGYALAPGLLRALDRAAQAWVLTGRRIYKRLAARRDIDPAELRIRVRTAEAADADAARHLVAAGLVTVP